MTIRSYMNAGARGATLIELMIVTGVIGILATIAVPSLMFLKKRGFDSSAVVAGNLARTAQEIYWIDNRDYAASLATLMRVQTHLADDPEVTFTFLGSSSEGYTFVTQHHRGDLSYRWSQFKD